eukprot:Gregarina_sp_Poly_1__10726@NODE_814_length_6190_cov_237_531439_g591_i0_p1_GENE_NODE_814_length_6190_cov_237_531439_g591_i0NODE_814_length_6190_cov_237_531439_g591_i0_p1_ORF_typecomplete_len745_score91_44TBCC/PF07986_12/1_9e20CAP_C/PF08603_11/3_6e03CAP_C/PF08603_11/3_2e05_NODE_814_length_6190_cov_237_531439_g591_i01132347
MPTSGGNSVAHPTSALFFRVEILDVAILPAKLNDAQVLTHLHRFLLARWKETYKHIELKPIVQDTKQPGWATGGSRVSLPLFITLQDWISFVGGQMEHNLVGRLHLSTAQKKAYWIRFGVVLYSLQQADLIRDAVKLASSKDSLLDREMFENGLIEFRYFSLLLWMQCWRVVNLSGLSASILPSKAAGFGAAVEITPRSQGRQRSVSDGAIDSYPVAGKMMELHGRSPKYSTLSPRGLLAKFGALSPPATQLDELSQTARDLFTRSLPTLLCLIGFHFQYLCKEPATTPEIEPSTSSESLSRLYLSTGHLKFLSLLLQLRQPSNFNALEDSTKRMPVNSKGLEKALYTELLNAKAITVTQVAPLVSVADFVKWFEKCVVVQVASVDVVTSSFLTSNSMGISPIPSRAYYRCRGELVPPYSKSSLLSPRGVSVDEIDIPSTDAISAARRDRRAVTRHRSASADHILISGKKREIFFLPSSQSRCNVCVTDCSDCVVFANSAFTEVKIVNVRNCRLVFPCVSGTVSVHFCKNITLHSASVGCLISNAYDVKAYLLTATPPVIVGDTRDLSVAPYNIEFSHLLELLNSAGLGFNSSLSNWCAPIVCPLSAMGRTSTPRETVKSEYQEEGMTPTVLKPQEFDILHVPCDSTKFPITTGNLILPEKYAKIYLDEQQRKQIALANFLKKLDACPTAEERRCFMQRVESRFSEWLQNNRKYSEILLMNRETHGSDNLLFDRLRPHSEIEGI